MPKGIPGSGPRVKQKRLEAKAQHGNPNIRNEGADGPEKPKPNEGEVAKALTLPAGVKSAKAETAAAVERSQDARSVERAQRDRMARVKSFKVEGNALGSVGAFVGTAGTEDWRDVLATLAEAVLVPGGYFYITRHDRGGRGSDYAMPTVWFECEVEPEFKLADRSPEVARSMAEVAPTDDDEEFVF